MTNSSILLANTNQRSNYLF